MKIIDVITFRLQLIFP